MAARAQLRGHDAHADRGARARVRDERLPRHPADLRDPPRRQGRPDAARRARTRATSIAWSKTRGGPYTPTPIVYGDHLYSCHQQRRPHLLRREDGRAGLPAADRRPGRRLQRLARGRGRQDLPVRGGRRGQRRQGGARVRAPVHEPDRRGADGDARHLRRRHLRPRHASTSSRSARAKAPSVDFTRGGWHARPSSGEPENPNDRSRNDGQPARSASEARDGRGGRRGRAVVGRSAHGAGPGAHPPGARAGRGRRGLEAQGPERRPGRDGRSS